MINLRDRISDESFRKILESYQKSYKEYGCSPSALHWEKGKQNIRFYQLTKEFSMSGKRILDIGCGFGDFNHYLNLIGITDYDYFGIDLCSEFIEEAAKKNNSPRIRYKAGNFLFEEFDETFDYAIISGTLNHNLNGINNYEYVEEIIGKALAVCEEAISLDFLSDKVDYKCNEDEFFFYNPETVLSIAYKFTRNIILTNHALPFEFSVTIYKDDSFDRDKTVFHKFMKDNSIEFEKRIFTAGRADK